MPRKATDPVKMKTAEVARRIIAKNNKKRRKAKSGS
jgi:hypothetical protein